MPIKSRFIYVKFPPPLKWTSPPPGYFKLTTDGAAMYNPGQGGIGRVIRDSQGNRVVKLFLSPH